MHLFIEKGLRGGISMVSTCFANANNPMMKDYDKSKTNSWMMYLDENNLYGWAMSQALPTGGLEWVKEAQEALTLEANVSKGYILEADLEYPKELHAARNDYSLAPERLEVKKTWMSGYQKNLLNTMYGVYIKRGGEAGT